MAYSLKKVTIRTDNSPEGMARIGELWQHVMEGRLPLMADSSGAPLEGMAAVSEYSGYASDENGEYDMSIIAAPPAFFRQMEQETSRGVYAKYEESGDDVGACAQAAWARVWADKQAGRLNRAYTHDYECTMPAEFSQDGRATCCLYIAVE